jgi:hypothetical protein
MPITFENDNDVIVYALEKVISYARRTQQIFVAQCVWWIAGIIGLEESLVIYIDRLHGRTVEEKQPTKGFGNPVNQVTPELQDPEDQASQEDHQDRILRDCEEYLKDSRRLRDIAALKATGKTLTGCINPTAISKKRLKKKDRRKGKPAEVSRKDTSSLAGIDSTEIGRRKETGECLRCAWPSDRKGAHRVKDCRRPIKLSKGTAVHLKSKNFQERLQKEISDAETCSEESSDDSL